MIENLDKTLGCRSLVEDSFFVVIITIANMNELNKAIKTAGSTSPEGLIAIKIPIKPIIVADHRRIFTTSCKNNIVRNHK